jgi:hypothetical protein
MAAWSGPSSCSRKRSVVAQVLEPDVPGQRADAPSFCPKPDLQPSVAAIGIFSLEEHVKYRQAIRATWLRSAPAANMTAHFVLRGLNARQSMLAEAAAHGDVVFVRATAKMSCKSGPLRKLMMWLACAIEAWPQAAMIGKADDDAWVHLPGIAIHVTTSLAALRTGGSKRSSEDAAPSVVWGFMESYHWHEGVHRPVGFMGIRYAHRRLPGEGRLERCRRRLAPPLQPLPRRDVPKAWLAGHEAHGQSGPSDAPANVTGPFFFAKGPCYLVSRSLVRRVVEDPWVGAEVEAAVKSGEEFEEVRELTWPWEDVFLGAALSRVSHAPSELVAVHAGTSGRDGVFSEVGVQAIAMPAIERRCPLN